MERIACIIDHVYIYWSSVILVLAAGAAVCAFLALYLRGKKRTAAAILFVPMAAAMSLVLSRLACWYFRPDSYENLKEALDIRTPGGFALMGTFAGCFLAAVLIRTIKLEKDLPDLLDCLCTAGGLGIAVGRLASFFNTSGWGKTVGRDYGMPWVAAVSDPVSGMPEYRLATFLIQAVAAGLITLVLLAVYLSEKQKSGDVCLLFLLLHGGSQVVLDSTRYDSLCLRSNGFVSAVQLLAAVALVTASVIWSVRMVRSGGWKKWHIMLWLGQAGCLSLAGYMEYYVQRHGNRAIFSYGVMSGALAVFTLLTLTTAFAAAAEERSHAEWQREIGMREDAC